VSTDDFDTTITTVMVIKHTSVTTSPAHRMEWWQRPTDNHYCIAANSDSQEPPIYRQTAGPHMCTAHCADCQWQCIDILGPYRLISHQTDMQWHAWNITNCKN